jgi:predicted nucleotidyltransferase/plasmid maintenance system antidote protein VapI
MSKISLGQQLRDLRKNKDLPLRKVAAHLDIDVAILSKMERGERKLTREIVLKLAELFQQNPEPLMIRFLSEKVLYEIGDEELAHQALKAVEPEVAYRTGRAKSNNEQFSKEKIIMMFHDYLAKRKLVHKAWLFGSMARGDNTSKSDIDIVIERIPKQPFTFFDLSELKENFERLAKRKVDVVMINGLRPKMKSRIESEMILFYEA